MTNPITAMAEAMAPHLTPYADGTFTQDEIEKALLHGLRTLKDNVSVYMKCTGCGVLGRQQRQGTSTSQANAVEVFHAMIDAAMEDV